jgi:hypothetical protein
MPRMKSNTIWALVTGLAVGFLVGHEWSGGKGGGGEPSKAGATANGPTAIPSDWITEKDINATEQFAGLTPQQRYAALKVLNERPCDCGCPHGSTIKCKKEDPGCPRAPTVIADVVAHAKLGETPEQITAAVQKKPTAPPAAQPPPGQPQKVELAQWTPVKGPKASKVTIVEFSDFQ